jgi:hypothetical protein
MLIETLGNDEIAKRTRRSVAVLLANLFTPAPKDYISPCERLPYKDVSSLASKLSVYEARLFIACQDDPTVALFVAPLFRLLRSH